MQWSTQQQAIFQWFGAERGNLVVRARAGTGKTTTILEGVTQAPERQILLAAFNKRIATELQTRIRDRRVEAKTLHGVGYKYVAAQWRGVNVDDGRVMRHVKRVAGDQEPEEILVAIAKIAEKGKEIVPHAEDGFDLAVVAREFDLLPDFDEYPTWNDGRVLSAAYDVMQLACVPDGSIGFADMLYVPVRRGWVRPWWDLVVVDEAQDMSPVQLELAVAACRRGGRIAIVGDDRQAIYRFRGADSGSLDRMRVQLKAKELGLTVTRRCPRAVVVEAQKIVQDFRAAPEAPDGVVRWGKRTALAVEAKPGDYVLSRTNAPLAATCLALLRAGVRSRIEGSDVAKAIIKLIRKLAPGATMEVLLERLHAWEEKEISKATAAEMPTRIEAVQDQAATIREMSEDLATVEELTDRIETLFAPDGGPAVVCSSVHRAKGLEADRVFVLNWTLYCGRERDLGNLDEANIEYVAITRAKEELVRVWDDSTPGAARPPN